MLLVAKLKSTVLNNVTSSKTKIYSLELTLFKTVDLSFATSNII
jgi:hypothetical protein